MAWHELNIVQQVLTKTWADYLGSPFQDGGRNPPLTVSEAIKR